MAKGVILEDKITGGQILPVTSSDLVFDPVNNKTQKEVNDELFKEKAVLVKDNSLEVRSISKKYNTLALALADKNPIDTATSLPLTVGQFVSIVDDEDKNGIYRIGSISGDGTMSLELQGKLGDLSEYAKKETLTEYVKDETLYTKSNNLIDISKIQKGVRLNGDGSETPESNFWLSDFIPIEANETISIASSELTAHRIGFYDKDKVFVRILSTVKGESQYVIGDNDMYVYFKINPYLDIFPPIDMMINRGGVLLPLEVNEGLKIKDELLPDIKDDFDIQDYVLEDDIFNVGNQLKPEQLADFQETLHLEDYILKDILFNSSNNLLDLSKIELNTEIDIDGTKITKQNYWLSDYINAEVGDIISLTTSSTSAPKISYYDSSKSFLGRGNANLDTEKFTIPKVIGTKFIRVSAFESIIPHTSMMINRGGVLLPLDINEGLKIKAELLPKQVEPPEVDLTEIKRELEDYVRTQIPTYEPSIPRLSFELISSGTKQPLWLSMDGEVIYGIQGNTLFQSRDEWETFETIGDGTFPSQKLVNGVRELNDGELIFSYSRDELIKAEVYKTVGYDRNNPSAATFKLVHTSLSEKAFFSNPWGFSVYDNIVILSEYGMQGPDGNRYVYLSTDNGDTFNMIFDLYTADVDGRPPIVNNAHIHTGAYDPYYNRIWVVCGDGTNTATYYSDNLGVSWSFVNGSNVVQYTGIICLPDSVVFGSDRAPNGLHIYRRVGKETKPTIEPYYVLNDVASITNIGMLPFKRDYKPTTPVYFSMQGVSIDTPSIIMGFVDGKKAHMIWEGDSSGDLYGRVSDTLGATAQGNIISSIYDSGTGQRKVVKARAPIWEKV